MRAVRAGAADGARDWVAAWMLWVAVAWVAIATWVPGGAVVAAGAVAAGVGEGRAADFGVLAGDGRCPQFVLGAALAPDPLTPGRPLVPCDPAVAPEVPGAAAAPAEDGVIWAQAWAAACSAAVPTYGGIEYRPASISRCAGPPAALHA